MSDLDQLLNTRGQSTEFGAFVTAACFAPANGQPCFALGDGTLRLGADADFITVAAHPGAVLSLCPHPQGGFLSGGDDGRLMRTAGNEAAEIQKFGSKWVEHVASFAGKTSYLAVAVGKTVHLFTGAGEKLRELAHPSTVTGIVFDAKGKRIAASHYNGASLWFVASKSDHPRTLEWRGSHTAIALSPDGDSVVTAMQENALHGWRLSDGQHMRMSGYPAKTRALSFTRSGKWLATSGAEAVVLWPFTGGGPMGKTPTELGGADGTLCTAVACHPQHEAVAAGFSDGVVLLADIASGRLLPVMGPGRGPVSALAWSPDGARLAFGTESGFAAVVDFSKA